MPSGLHGRNMEINMNFKRMVCPTGFVAIILFSSMAAGQGKETLTNAKILEMVKMGLSEALIVSKINKSNCDCDTSMAAISKLKAAKISDAVIMAMMDSTPENYSDSRPTNSNGKSPTQSPASSVEPPAGEKHLKQIAEPGIYLFEDGKMSMFEPTVYRGTKSSFWKSAITYGIAKSKIRAIVGGKSANMQVSTRRPEFYFVFSREFSNPGAVMSGFGGYAATSPNEFMMISMVVKGSSREVTLGEFNAFASSTGVADKEIREYSFEKIKPGLYKVVPKTDLAPGEYCFFYAGTGGAGGKIFDFSVK